MPGGYTDTGLTLEGFLFLQVRGTEKGKGGNWEGAPVNIWARGGGEGEEEGFVSAEP